MLLTTTTLLIVTTVADIDTFANIIEDTHMDGFIRSVYERHHIKDDNSYKYGTLGIKLHLESAPFYGISLGASLYGARYFNFNNDDEEIDRNTILLGEAYIKSKFQNSMLQIGRQEIDTPFAYTDTIESIPNTFEAYVFENKDIPETNIFLGQIQRMAGLNGDDTETFSRINDHQHMQVAGISYEGIENLALHAWYYRLKEAEINSISYAEASYADVMHQLAYEIVMQYSKQNYSETDNASIYGIATSLQYVSFGFTIGFAYNTSQNNTAFSGFGGAPFVSSAEYLILDDAGEDGSQTWMGTEFDASVVGVEGLTLNVGYTSLKDNAQNTATELDIGVNYEINEYSTLDVIISDVKESQLDEKDSKHVRVFLDYNF